MSEVIPLTISMCLCVWVLAAQRETFRFWWDPQVLTHLPYWFSLVFLFALPGDGMSQLVPAGEGECERQTNREMMRKKQEKKTQGRKIEKRRRKRQEGPASSLITGALADPWPWSWPRRLPHRSEVVWKCQCGNSLHCWVMMILCSLPSLSDMISVALRLRLPRATHPSLTRPHKAH